MKNEIEINKDILCITNTLRKKFPELSKYMSEMPVKISYDIDAKISSKNLKDYYDSLNELMNHYAITHKNKLHN